VLLASDVLYEAGNRDLLEGLSRAGRTVIAADPLRPGNVRFRADPVRVYDVETVPNVDAPCASASVYVL
jgi:hypothetical protein